MHKNNQNAPVHAPYTDHLSRQQVTEATSRSMQGLDDPKVIVGLQARVGPMYWAARCINRDTVRSTVGVAPWDVSASFRSTARYSVPSQGHTISRPARERIESAGSNPSPEGGGCISAIVANPRIPCAQRPHAQLQVLPTLRSTLGTDTGRLGQPQARVDRDRRTLKHGPWHRDRSSCWTKSACRCAIRIRRDEIL